MQFSAVPLSTIPPPRAYLPLHPLSQAHKHPHARLHTRAKLKTYKLDKTGREKGALAFYHFSFPGEFHGESFLSDPGTASEL